MKVYTVHERGAAAVEKELGSDIPVLSPIPADRIDRAEQLVFIGDGFSWLAAELPPAMLIAHKLWVGLAIYAAALAAIAVVFWSVGAAPGWIVLAVATLHVIFGFEFNELRRSSLDAKAWSNLGTVTGKSCGDCERRFLDTWLPRQPLIMSPTGQNEAPRQVSVPKPSGYQAPKRKFNLPWTKR